MSFRVDESMYFLELLGASGALQSPSLQDEPRKSSVLRRRERTFQKTGVSRRREATCFLKVAFRVDETSTCKGTFKKVALRVDESIFFLELLGASWALRRPSLQGEPKKSSVSRRRERSFQKKLVFRVDEKRPVFLE